MPVHIWWGHDSSWPWSPAAGHDCFPARSHPHAKCFLRCVHRLGPHLLPQPVWSVYGSGCSLWPAFWVLWVGGPECCIDEDGTPLSPVLCPEGAMSVHSTCMFTSEDRDLVELQLNLLLFACFSYLVSRLYALLFAEITQQASGSLTDSISATDWKPRVLLCQLSCWLIGFCDTINPGTLCRGHPVQWCVTARHLSWSFTSTFVQSHFRDSQGLCVSLSAMSVGVPCRSDWCLSGLF